MATKPQDTNNIERYRKKRRRKLRVKRLVGFLAVLILAVGAVVAASIFDLSEIGSWFSSSEGDGGTFPRKLMGDRAVSFTAFGENLELVTSSKIYRYNADGSLLYSSPHSYSSPAAESNGKVTLLYGIGGYSFRIDNQTGTLYEKELTNKVLCGAISSDSQAAIVTSEDRYTSSVTVYNASGTQNYKWYAFGEHITDVCFFPGNNGVAVACAGAENGQLYTCIYYLDFSITDETKIANLKLYDTMVLDMTYQSGGQLCIVGDDRVVFSDGQGQQTAAYHYTSALKDYTFMADGIPVLLMESYSSTGVETLLAVDGDGNVIGSKQLEQEGIDLSGDSGGVALLTGSTAYYYDTGLTQKDSVNVGTGVKRVCVVGSEGYVLSLSEIAQYHWSS